MVMLVLPCGLDWLDRSYREESCWSRIEKLTVMAYNYYDSKGELNTKYPTYTGRGFTGVFKDMLYGH